MSKIGKNEPVLKPQSNYYEERNNPKRNHRTNGAYFYS